MKTSWVARWWAECVQVAWSDCLKMGWNKDKDKPTLMGNGITVKVFNQRGWGLIFRGCG